MEVSKKSSLEQIKERMQKKLEDYPPYALEKIYIEYKSKNLAELKQKFESCDKAGQNAETKSNLVSQDDFFNILEEIIMMTDKQKEMLTKNLVKNGKPEDGIPYNIFMDCVNVSSDENLQKITKNYLLEHNDYLLVLVDNINVNNLNYKEIWIDVNKGVPKTDKIGFRNFLNAPKFNTGNFQNLFNDEDKDYIFSLISSNGTDLFFKDLVNCINKILSNDNLTKSEEAKQNITEVINILKTNKNNNSNNNLNNNSNNNLNNNSNNNSNNNEIKEIGFQEEKNLGGDNAINQINNNNNIDNNNNNIDNNAAEDIKTSKNSDINKVIEENKEKGINDIFKNYLEHPYINVRSPEKFSEVQNAGDQIFFVIQNRLKVANDKILDILKFHQRYTVLKLYYKIFYIFQSLGNEPYVRFQSKDPEQKLLISNFEFFNVLNSFNLNLDAKDFELIIKSLNFKTDKLSSYDEFLKKVYNIQSVENNDLRRIFHDCNILFNDYLVDFRHYIIDNKVDYQNAYLKTCSSMTQINYEYFNKFLNEIGYKLSHEEETKFLYSNLCDNNYLNDKVIINTDEFIIRDALFDNFLKLKECSEVEFLKTGIISIEKQNNNEWKKNIKQFTDSTKKLYIDNYKHLKPTFLNIYEKCISYCVSDLTNFFDKRGDISPEGDILTDQFMSILSTIGISQNLNFDSLLNKFKYPTGPKKGVYFQLAEFLSIYNLFKDEKEQENKNKINFGEEEIQKATELVPGEIKPVKKTDEKFVFSNAKRDFTQDDINYVGELCNFIANIIIDENGESVTNFFNRCDKNQEGFLTIDQLKKILSDDLQIEVDGEDAEDIKIFLDFVTDDKQVKSNDIVKLKKIIHVITGYSGRDAPENSSIKKSNININTDINNTGDINTSINTKKVKFDFDEGFQGTEAGNVNLDNKNKNNENVGVRLANINPIQYESPNEKLAQKIISDFSHYLNNNKIKFNSIFPTIDLFKDTKNQNINSDILFLGFKNANFPLNKDNFVILLNHFDPENTNNIKVNDLIEEIMKYEPKYFNQPFQNPESQNNFNQYRSAISQSSGVAFSSIDNTKFLNGMGKILGFLENNKISPEIYFRGKFKPKLGEAEKVFIDDKNLIEKLCEIKDADNSDKIPNLTPDEVELIYKKIDITNNNQVSLEDIIKFFGDSQTKKNTILLNKNDKNFLNKTIENEINSLYESFDTEKEGKINKDQFYKCLKSVDHKAIRKDAEEILNQVSPGNPNEITKNDFINVMFKYIEKQLVMQDEEKNYFINLFKEADIDNNGYLTKNQMKNILKNKIECSNLSDEDIDTFLEKIDFKNDNQIEIREFVSLLDNINNNNDPKKSSDSTLLNNNNLSLMNLNYNINMFKNIRPKDFVSLYRDLPILFIPSFIREEQQKLNLLPSSCLKPQIQDEVFYEDILPLENLLNENIGNNNKNEKILSPIDPKINSKISFQGYATGVCSPEESLFINTNSQYKIVGRILKIAMFNNLLQKFIGDSVSIDCIYNKDYQDRWYFEENKKSFNNNIIIRYNKEDFKSIDIIFEFVIAIQKKIQNKNYTIEVSCGWCKAPMKWLLETRDEKLPIYGGSPFAKEDLNYTDIITKRSGVCSCCSRVVSELPIRIKHFTKMNKNDKLFINYLPTFIICHRAAIHMISIYRKILGNYILNNENYGLKFIKVDNNICNIFCKIADVPDAFQVMNELYREIAIDGGPYFQRNNVDYQKVNFEKFVNRIYNAIYVDNFKYNPRDPTDLPRGDIKLMQDRDIILNSALRNDMEDFNKLEYKNIDNYSFKPFTMDEINGQDDTSLLGKLDEIVHWVDNSN